MVDFNSRFNTAFNKFTANISCQILLKRLKLISISDTRKVFPTFVLTYLCI